LVDKAVLQFYDNKKLWPDGLTSKLPACKEWSARMGLAITRLDLWLWIFLIFVWDPGLVFVRFTLQFFFFVRFTAHCNEAARFRPLALRSNTSKNAALQWIRDEIAGWVVPRLAV
jgi:hypothetical protein